jgi:hypothetical protein
MYLDTMGFHRVSIYFRSLEDQNLLIRLPLGWMYESGGIDRRTGRQDYQIVGRGDIKNLIRFLNRQMEDLADKSIIEYDYDIWEHTWCNLLARLFY